MGLDWRLDCSIRLNWIAGIGLDWAGLARLNWIPLDLIEIDWRSDWTWIN